MNKHNLLYYHFALFTGALLPLLKVAALGFDKPVLLDPVRASWGSMDADQHASEVVKQVKL